MDRFRTMIKWPGYRHNEHGAWKELTCKDSIKPLWGEGRGYLGVLAGDGDKGLVEHGEESGGGAHRLVGCSRIVSIAGVEDVATVVFVGCRGLGGCEHGMRDRRKWYGRTSRR